jgi:hypothetical protein
VAIYRFVEVAVGIVVALALTALWPEQDPAPAPNLAPNPAPRAQPLACYNPAMPADLESRMNFIVEHQAQLAVELQALKDRQLETARQQDVNTGQIRQLVDVSMSLARHGEQTNRLMRELRDAQAQGERLFRALIEAVEKLTGWRKGS